MARADGNPQHGDSGHAGLASLLDESDVALARRPGAVEDAAFDVDPDADPAGTFPQGVASGGPTPEGVILWTRLDPDAFAAGDGRLGVEVADAPGFDGADVVHRGVVTDDGTVEAHDHTVKVDLDGLLAPGERYHYRFVYDGVASRPGRCHTLPAPDATPDRLALAVLTCQDYANGYFPAWSHVAREDVDFVVHVGDFVYESAAGEFTGVGSLEYEGRELSLPSGHDRAHTLADYRYLHRTYRRDPHLQRGMAAHTFLPAWDDHEIADDIYWDPEADAPAADHPKGDDPEFMTRLAADAMHAWWEYTPARVGYDPDADRLQDRVELWGHYEFGDLVDLVMTDERLFRDPPKEIPGGVPTREATAPKYEPDDRSMLGDDQREWFLDRMTGSTATWTVWCDEVLTVPFKLGAGPTTVFPVQGGWDGYVRERRQISEALYDADVGNVVTLTGDAHCYVAGYKQVRYDDTLPGLLFGSRFGDDDRIGVEFMTPPTTSVNVAEAVGLTHPLRRWLGSTLTRSDEAAGRGRLDRATEDPLSRFVELQNPHLELFDSHRWGYSTVEFAPEACTWTAYAVDKSVDTVGGEPPSRYRGAPGEGPPPDADREVVAAYRVPEGRVELEDVTDRARTAHRRAGDGTAE